MNTAKAQALLQLVIFASNYQATLERPTDTERQLLVDKWMTYLLDAINFCQIELNEMHDKYPALLLEKYYKAPENSENFVSLSVLNQYRNLFRVVTSIMVEMKAIGKNLHWVNKNSESESESESEEISVEKKLNK